MGQVFRHDGLLYKIVEGRIHHSKLQDKMKEKIQMLRDLTKVMAAMALCHTQASS